MTSDICSTLANGEVNIIYSNCSSNMINGFGLIMVIEGLARNNYISYNKLSTNI